ncbi:DNA repair protein RecO [Candidatus Gottesmanbacteria bacterium RIFCSPHIGHO2_02_FULL_39_14]|uniref:DNA repair protein RecO n=3 Tax=Candidatus Gottesmaniibacteriota TaxID=1752720 RepID=A0A1F6A024_9BACT|nr:MAG: DNA repair protein RecO [Candidatus Gottesmanbacteria bacterium RBG_16_38_7b]OGG18051.1 MAG: DNA repair protein RecO [Candidatus Gottesmanbacteria bacterium RIFCSPHIGHO2_02_FULL_39_14]OGG32402.1 MAG: DNA repair protein RecO [Candidatus Gottesmanbacteria bacterium RIFCSPLOWO2_02_FULL_38_8]
MIRSYKIECLVVRKNKIGETDNRLTVLSKDQGLMIVLARGIRKINSRRSPHLDLLNHVKLYLAKGKTFDIVTDVEPLNHFSELKTHLSRIACAYKMIELINKLLPEKEEQSLIFNRLLSDLHILNSAFTVDEIKLTEDFANFLLMELGFLPRDKKLVGRVLDTVLEEVCERKIQSNVLLSKLL